jgi:putative tricarboxylic transport membrane protein
MNSSVRNIRIIVLALLAVSAAALAKDPAGAASFTPNRPIEFIIFASPGGGSGNFAEVVGGIMEKEKLVPVAVPRVYKPGGSQAVGMAYLAEKKGSPYHLGSTSNSYVLAGLTGASKTITHKDFTDIAILAFDENVVMVKYDSPYKTLKDVVAAAKAKPKSIKVGGSNVGGTDSLLTASLAKAGGVQFNYIAFQGGGEVNAALLGGHIDFMSANPTEVMPQIEGKTMRALAVAAEKRLPGLKDVPTMKEMGYDVIFNTFRGINAPPGAPAEATAYYRQVAKKVSETAAFKKYIADNHMTLKYVDDVQTRKHYDAFAERCSVLLRELGVIKK